MKYFKIFSILFVIVFVFAIPSITSAAPIGLPALEEKVIFGGTFTLESGESIDGSLVILGGVVSLEEDSIVRGDVVLIGGTLTVKGEITKNLVAVGGVINLSETAIVIGDLVAPASAYNKDDGAQIYGDIISDASSLDINFPDFDFANSPFFVFGRSPAASIVWLLFQSIAVSVLAMVVVLIVPDQTKRTGSAITANPALSGGLGCLSLIVSFIVVVILTIMIITIPAALLVGLVLLLALFFGWIVVGLEVGKRIGDAFDRAWSPVIQAGVGTFSIALIINGIQFALWDCINGLIIIVILSIGFGAVLLTRFGSREYGSPSAYSGLNHESNLKENPEISGTEESDEKIDK